MRALLVIDVQNDFCPGGALAVRDGDAVVPIINKLMTDYGLVVATQDWHPRNHGSFASQHGKEPYAMGELAGLPQVMWPDHCVQETAGADFHALLEHERFAHVSRKGTDPSIDSYSGFFDNGHKKKTDLDAYLRAKGVDAVDVVGLATDYCVKFTALDGKQLGYDVRVLEKACRGVELAPGDIARAITEMREAGVEIA
jgi:nicotinamidase/pyrazinamidase